MSDKEVTKIRHLVYKHPDEKDIVVLNDLLEQLIAIQVPLGKNEVLSVESAMREAIKGLTEHEKLVSEFKHRLRTYILPDVIANKETRPKPSKKSLENLKKK